jgi:hypothetical protein
MRFLIPSTRWQVSLMSKKTSVLRASLTGVGGLLGASIAAVVVGALVLVPLPQYVGAAPSLELNPVASAQRRVCPGPLVQVSSDKTATVSYLSNGPAELITDSTSTSAQTSSLQMIDNKAPASLGTPTVISIPADKGATAQPMLAGTQSQVGMGEALAGLAVAACADSTNDMWLVAGATNVGRTSLVMLSNPTDVASTVKLEIYGENGVVDAVKNDGILVAPKTQRIVSLAGYARDVVAPVVHVTSVGGQILASLQQNVTRTLVPSGVELVNPGAAPNTVQVMTGVYLQGHANQAASENGAVLSDLESAVRVLAPGPVDADVIITFVSATGETSEIKSTVAAKKVLQFPMASVKDGTYTVIVKSSQPVLAAARAVYDSSVSGIQSPASTATPAPSTAPATPAPTSGGDFAWFAAGNFLTNSMLLPVPSVPNPTVSFYNPTDHEVKVTLSARNEQDLILTIPAEKMVISPLKALTRYTVKGTLGLLGGLTAVGSGTGSAMALNPANALGSAVLVFPR